MKAFAIFLFLYLGACGGAFLLWLVSLALVAAHILTKAAPPWCAGMGAILGLLWMIALLTQPCRDGDCTE